MEDVIVINRPEDFKYWTSKFRRIYFGNEFCPQLLPSKKDLDALMKFIKEKSLKLTLLTPQADSEGLETVKKTINYLARKQILEEVVVNDYGVLHYLKKGFPYCQVILGRMLSFSFPNCSGLFLKKIGIRRLEFDNLGFIRVDKAQSINAVSYYYPFMLFFATRYCPVAGIAHNKSKNPGIIKCSQECLKIGELKTKSPCLLKTAILRGNAQFVEKRFNFNELKEAPVSVDRLVFQPQPPV